MRTTLRKLSVLLGALALLAGCASTESTGWTKPGMTEEQLARDRMDCMSEAQQVMPSASGPRMKVDYSRYQRCMAARGYSGTATN
jgi:hypothetical protein